MRIIKQGKPPEEKEYTASCTNCQTKFIAQEQEGHRYSDVNIDPTRSFSDKIVFKCPTCSHRVTIIAQ